MHYQDPGSLEVYSGQLCAWLQEQEVKCPTGIIPRHIWAYLVGLQRRGLRDTTQHAHARAIKTWLNWLSQEQVLEVSPMRKVSMPKLDRRIQPRFTPEEVKALLALCDSSPRGLRHGAIILGLLDSGLRASESVSLKVDDVDMRTGLVTVVGKGNKHRQVRFGVKTRKSILKYLAGRKQGPEALWMAQRESLTLRGLESISKRLEEKAGVKCHPHRFGRTFALWCLRDRMDLHSLSLLTGHSTLAVLQRHLALAGEDIERAQTLHSPVDNPLRACPLASKNAMITWGPHHLACSGHTPVHGWPADGGASCIFPQLVSQVPRPLNTRASAA